jgi:hypothetical protein
VITNYCWTWCHQILVVPAVRPSHKDAAAIDIQEAGIGFAAWADDASEISHTMWTMSSLYVEVFRGYADAHFAICVDWSYTVI